ncbi:MAG: DUF1624 domain-containing protein [Oligoflexia bacterium]|nr:DUF1624 domain-containing protein [Oligoflexia bacterium]
MLIIPWGAWASWVPLIFAAVIEVSYFTDMLPYDAIPSVRLLGPSLDYEPIYPWFSVVLLGIWSGAIGKHLAEHMVKHFFIPGTIGRAVVRSVLFCGRHSLIIYLLHHPLIFGCCLLSIKLLRVINA